MLQSLEDGVVIETVLSLAGLQSWHSLSYGRFQMELCLQPDLIKKWKRSSKKSAAEAMSKGEQFDPSSSPKANFVRGLIEEFVDVLDHGVFADGVDASYL
uniref:RNA helicase aquarius N-terminal domain-containing protein n=1 Tax=Brassica oleracea var. oleracea TaxID=109376 RepID=A0A0D3C3B8_BRAOL